MLCIQPEVILVTVDSRKRIRKLCGHVVESKWLSIPQAPWHTRPSPVKKESDRRVLMSGISTSKCQSHGQRPMSTAVSPGMGLAYSAAKYVLNTY